MTCHLNRRQILIAGAGLGVALAARTAAGAEDLPTSGAAYEPWRSWRSDAAEGPVGLLRSAILAANAHDTQPWLFCVAPDRIDIFADESRNLGAMDPFRREMQLSLGCAIENLVLAARSQGFDPGVTPVGGTLSEAMGGPRLVARIDLRRGDRAASPLVDAIPKRHTNRAAYDRDRPVGAETLDQLRLAAPADQSARLVFVTEPSAQADFAAATLAATEAIIADQAMIADSDAWFRGTDAEIEAHRDGPTLYAAGLSPMTLFLARLFSVSPERSHRAWLDNTRNTQLASAASFGLIVVRDLYASDQALAAGRLWQRLQLTATAMGLGMQPLNQLPERVDRERQLGTPAMAAKSLASLTGDPAWQATFAFRMGWPLRGAPASPRRDLPSVILPGGCVDAAAK